MSGPFNPKKPLITVAPGPKMAVGVNYPWWGDKYGIFLGDNSIPWETDLEQMLTSYSKLNVRLIRVFMLANLALYGTVVGAGESAVFTPPPSCPFSYIDGTVRLLKVLKNAGARAILSLVDFGAFCTQKPGTTHRHAIITNPAIRKKFLDDVLDTLLVESLPFKEQILAWEVMNEPIWAIKSTRLNPGAAFGPVASIEQMVEFLKEALVRIEAKGFASTVGHANIDDLDEFPLGTMPQFHFYPTSYWGNRLRFRSETNAFVGEFSSKLGEETTLPTFLQADAMARPWPDLEGADTHSTKGAVLSRLRFMNSRGYRFALLWPDSDANTVGFDKLSTLAKAAISEYDALVP